MISQPMYFPWIGWLQQVNFADVIIFYDEAQFTNTGYSHRVKIRTSPKDRWLTVPRAHTGEPSKLRHSLISDTKDWRAVHRHCLTTSYSSSPYLVDMLEVVDTVFEQELFTISDIGIASCRSLSSFFSLDKNREFLKSSSFALNGGASEKVQSMVQEVGGTTYVTGHGAANYLDHEAFERAGISVRYMHYNIEPYPQLHDGFNPYVSSLDAIANLGTVARHLLKGSTVDWREFLETRVR